MMSQNSHTVQANPLLQALKILGVAASASIDDVKIAYRRLAKRYHPDKAAGTADQQMYQAVEWAYKTVTSAYQEWNTAAISDQNQLRSDKRQEISVPQIIAPDKFTPQHFNNTFAQVKGATLQDPTVEHGVYDVDDSQYRPRQMADYQRQHSQIEAEMQQTRPLFRGGFNQQIFNQTFEQQQALHGQGLATSTALAAYSGPPIAQGGAIYAATPYTELSAQGAQRTVTAGASAQYADNNWHRQAVPHATAVAVGRASYQGVDTPAHARDLESRMTAYRNFDAKAVIGAAGQQTTVGSPAVYQNQPTPHLLPAPIPPSQSPVAVPVSPATPVAGAGVYYRSAQQTPALFAPPVQQTPITPSYHYQHAVVPATSTTPSNAMMEMWSQQQMMQLEQTQQMNRLAQMNQTYMNEQITMLKNINQVLNQYREEGGHGHSRGVQNKTARVGPEPGSEMSANDLKELQELRRLVKIQHALIDQIEKEGLPPS